MAKTKPRKAAPKQAANERKAVAHNNKQAADTKAAKQVHLVTETRDVKLERLFNTQKLIYELKHEEEEIKTQLKMKRTEIEAFERDLYKTTNDLTGGQLTWAPKGETSDPEPKENTGEEAGSGDAEQAEPVEAKKKAG